MLHAHLPILTDPRPLAALAPRAQGRAPKQAPLPSPAHIRRLWSLLDDSASVHGHLAACLALQTVASFRTADLLQVYEGSETALGWELHARPAKVSDTSAPHLTVPLPSSPTLTFVSGWLRQLAAHQGRLLKLRASDAGDPVWAEVPLQSADLPRYTRSFWPPLPPLGGHSFRQVFVTFGELLGLDSSALNRLGGGRLVSLSTTVVLAPP